MLKAYHDDEQFIESSSKNLPRITLTKPAKSKGSTLSNLTSHQAIELPGVTKPAKMMHNQAVQVAAPASILEHQEKKKPKKPKVIAEPVPIELPIDKKGLSNSKLVGLEEEPQNLNDISVSSTETVFGKDGARRKQKRQKPPTGPVLIEGEIAQTYRPKSNLQPKLSPQEDFNNKSDAKFVPEPADRSNGGPTVQTWSRPGSKQANMVNPASKDSKAEPDQPKYIKVKLPNEQFVYLTRSEHLAFHLALREASALKDKTGDNPNSNSPTHRSKREAGVETDIRGDDILDYPDDPNEETELNRQMTEPPSVVEIKKDTPRVEIKAHKTSKSIGTDGLYESGAAVKPRQVEQLPNLQRLPAIPKAEKLEKQSAPLIPSLKEKMAGGIPSDAGGGLGTMSDVRLSVNETQRDPSKKLLPVLKIDKESQKQDLVHSPLEKAVLPSLTMIGKAPTQLPPIPVLPPPQESPKPQTKSFGSDFDSTMPPKKAPQQSTFGAQTDRVKSINIETQHQPDKIKTSSIATITEPAAKPKLAPMEIVHQKHITIAGKSPVQKKFKEQGIDAASRNQKTQPQVILTPVFSQTRVQPRLLVRVEPLTIEKKQKVERATETEASVDPEVPAIEREEVPTIFQEESRADEGMSGFLAGPAKDTKPTQKNDDEDQDMYPENPEDPEEEVIEQKYYDLYSLLVIQTTIETFQKSGVCLHVPDSHQKRSPEQNPLKVC